MKKHLSLFLISIFILVTDCKRKTQRVAITPSISVELPINYKKNISHSTGYDKTNPDLIVKSTHDNFRARIYKDEVFISNTITKEFDTLNVEEKKERIKINLKGYMRGFNGRKLIQEEKIINGIAQGNFSFEVEIMDTLFMIYGRLIIQDTNFLILNYKTSMQITNRSIKEKDIFFKSIQFK